MEGNDVVNDVKEYYGKILKTKEDLKTNACCTGDSMPRYLRQILKDIHTDVTNKYGHIWI